ncbi:MarR family winged helix-turn-helix transcriptional regulator [Arthrobacter roseus]|uniref:MarR family winged helix-turn-helix transcriptional regulator n=1 Tax=Arthrobacter roseus TaxID=136274 RepID=UPI001962688C|nr:MarR family transcriptional regulator [Arthrobacter roseus]MBM7849507.1 DNA-binding MarR family transcriptional regulator [Arthrobacter roseus]
MQERPDFKLMLLMQQLTLETDRYVHAVSTSEKLHRTDLNAISLLVSARRTGATMTPGMLRRELNLSSAATTALVDRLADSGHVDRRPSSTDRRQIDLELTDKAIATGSAMFMPMAEHMGRAISSFSRNELAIVARFLEKAVSAAVEARQNLN